MSCAYYEASTHLLKYSRWLSLEILQSSIVDSANCAVVDGCATEWSLTMQNREKARKEMEDIVFNEHIDKTETGDRLVAFSLFPYGLVCHLLTASCQNLPDTLGRKLSARSCSSLLNIHLTSSTWASTWRCISLKITRLIFQDQYHGSIVKKS